MLKMPYGYQGSIRGQLKCVGPSNVANATEHYAAAGALVFNKMFRLFDDWICQLKVFGIITTFGFSQ